MVSGCPVVPRKPRFLSWPLSSAVWVENMPLSSPWSSSLSWAKVSPSQAGDSCGVTRFSLSCWWQGGSAPGRPTGRAGRAAGGTGNPQGPGVAVLPQARQPGGPARMRVHSLPPLALSLILRHGARSDSQVVCSGAQRAVGACPAAWGVTCTLCPFSRCGLGAAAACRPWNLFLATCHHGTLPSLLCGGRPIRFLTPPFPFL